MLKVALQAPPKSVPEEWQILRRKYDPYKNIIKNIDLENDGLQNIEKLNVSLCVHESGIVKNTPSRKSTSNNTVRSKLAKLIFAAFSQKDFIVTKYFALPRCPSFFTCFRLREGKKDNQLIQKLKLNSINLAK